jgi:hypothetical protein
MAGSYGAANAAPVIPAAESTLGSHPCVALSSAQVLPEWINRYLAVHRFAADGDNSLDFVSQPRGSLQTSFKPVLVPLYRETSFRPGTFLKCRRFRVATL